MKTLHLTLHRRWFDSIASGRKTEEYRALSPHWIRMLTGRHYRTVRFRNGYAPLAPEMEVECLGIRRSESCFVIALGKILWIRNYEDNPTTVH